ncbi:N-acetyltransferase [Kineosporia sp. NBRC 101677]|uniref:hypothetical protein n=1 Tax=Kineosporia sp. NBRC 101677 TaxID=3032197 RepID=UPI0024A0F146|nr:hypothetical protein [Kineosporia sp. NBRC 101677]GLY14904.1 N-acetyltransferase [Kineosporia sp. NBRC 101677]
MHFRPATARDLETLLAFPVDPVIGGIGPDRLREELAAGQMRLPWSWLVLDDEGVVVGRALWWGRSDSVTPLALDCLHLLERVDDRAAVAGHLLQQAHAGFTAVRHPPEYQLTLPTHWRRDPASVDAVSWRVAAAALAGLSEQTERLQYEWIPGDQHPTSSQRLRFRAGDEQEFLALFEQAAVGTLDVTTRRALVVMDPAAQARDDYNFYLNCPGERAWWRVATAPDGEPVIRLHADAGAERVTATTDVINVPMAAAFDRAGFRVTETRLMLEGRTTG